MKDPDHDDDEELPEGQLPRHEARLHRRRADLATESERGMRTSEIVVPLDQGKVIVKPLFVSRMSKGSSTQVRGCVPDEEVVLPSFRVVDLNPSLAAAMG